MWCHKNTHQNALKFSFKTANFFLRICHNEPLIIPMQALDYHTPGSAEDLAGKNLSSPQVDKVLKNLKTGNSRCSIFELFEQRIIVHSGVAHFHKEVDVIHEVTLHYCSTWRC